ncbi:MAG: iron ABC transporter permease, partial [Mesorhizobium sp.]
MAGPAGRVRASDGDRSARARIVILLLSVALALSIFLSLTSGASDASAVRVLRDWLTGGVPADTALAARHRLIVYDIRMPRVLLGVLIGAALAVSGAVMQGLFRNPLADPGLIGVSALGTLALPLAAFLGGLAVTLLLYAIATRHGRTSVATMLLAGLAIAALAMALTGILVFVADDRQLRDLTFWQLGSLGGATWPKIGTVGPVILLALATMPFLSRGLDALALGEATAGHLGIPVQRLKYTAIVGVSAAVGASVA